MLTRSFLDYLLEQLSNPEDAEAYLDATIADGDKNEIDHAIGQIAMAKNKLGPDINISIKEEFDRIIKKGKDFL